VDGRDKHGHDDLWVWRAGAQGHSTPQTVMPALVAGIHDFLDQQQPGIVRRLKSNRRIAIIPPWAAMSTS
jgi:hypothetical protein